MLNPDKKTELKYFHWQFTSSMFFMLQLDDYLMLCYSLRALILIFSKYKYSLVTPITKLNNIWIRTDSRKKNLKKKLGISQG